MLKSLKAAQSFVKICANLWFLIKPQNFNPKAITKGIHSIKKS